MTNWYKGVLKCVVRQTVGTADETCSTGKRRYGHPALTGVLPNPWLPIKPGETLANYVDDGGAPRTKADPNNAVVLTLRRKKSMARPQVAFTASPMETPGAPPGGTEAAVASANPWSSETRLSQPPQLRHRLSFDPATGVITLPDDVAEEDSDSEDVGSPEPLSPRADGPRESSEDGSASDGRTRRYSTYYHHPERRQSAAL